MCSKEIACVSSQGNRCVWRTQALDFSDSSNLFCSVTPLRKSFLLELLFCLENILPVEGRGLLCVECVSCDILKRTLDLESEGGSPSSTTCPMDGMTRNIYKHTREQSATKKSQPTQERGKVNIRG